jgi:hypothetical protein
VTLDDCGRCGGPRLCGYAHLETLGLRLHHVQFGTAQTPLG